MPNAKLHLVTDVEFIFGEVERFLELEKQWFETKTAPDELVEAFLWELPHPTDSKRRITCGRAAVERLDMLASLAAQRAGIRSQIEVRTMRDPLAKSLLRRFALEGRPIEIREVERSFSEAARIARRSLKTITHFVPCHLMVAESPDQFQIGPITFLSRTAFRRMMASRLWPARSENRSSYKFIRDVTQYYRTFGWVAEVTVPDCDSKSSENAALRAVTQALDCMHLLFGPSHTSRMVIGGPGVRRDCRGQFTVQNEKVEFSASYSGLGEVGFADDWISMMDDHEAQEAVRLFGVALEMVVNPRLNRPISERFLDAVSWYGEAARERSAAAKVIKYVTSLERMLMTDEKDNITDLISRRIAAFCFDPSETGSLCNWEKKGQKLYGLRSKLVHGSISQRDERVAPGAWDAAEIGRAAILNALHAFGERGLRDEECTRVKVASWFNKVTRHAQSIASPRPRHAKC
ncbi:HEPN domain-containing protein [Sphingomonas arenae]|uniref:HEPN domain-containing protein n=1 Tax=Sphingomonas arenae TaxID=2812555 RepID=UPI001967075E|nr:HEPN domain-containing protein [Sphingomonas arenae]